jgi:integrase
VRRRLGRTRRPHRTGERLRPHPPRPLAPASAQAARRALPTDRVPTFHEYATYWLAAKIDGVIGDTGGISQNTIHDYRTRLSVHLLPFFARYRLDEIDAQLCLDFKAFKLAEARELREAIAAGANLRDRRNRRLQPLSLSSVRRQIDLLRTILDEAIEDRHITLNPARGRRMRLRVPKPRRTFLEMDELATLLDVAAEQDRPLPAIPREEMGLTTRLVAHLLAQGRRPNQIARQLNLARSTVSWHLRRLRATPGRGYQGRRLVCELLGRSGIRASELCDLKIGQLRIHDPNGAHFDIPDAKTDTGIREVQMTPNLVEAVIDHLDRLQRAHLPHAPTDYLIPSTTGGRLSRQRVGRIVREAALEASRLQEARGLPALPNITPHSLRRTYISIALIANNFDVKWVMSQVGHADSKMTMDVYAQVEQRAHRRHGENFDRLLRESTTDARGPGPPASADQNLLIALRRAS